MAATMAASVLASHVARRSRMGPSLLWPEVVNPESLPELLAKMLPCCRVDPSGLRIGKYIPPPANLPLAEVFRVHPLTDVIVDLVSRLHLGECAALGDPHHLLGRCLAAHEARDARNDSTQVCLHVFKVHNTHTLGVAPREVPPEPDMLKVSATILCRPVAS